MTRKQSRAQRDRAGETARSEHGGALVFVLLIATALLFIAGSSLQTGLRTRRFATQQMHAKQAFFCAETALDRGRAVVGANRDTWNTVLGGGGVGWHPVVGQCPGAPATYTYSVTIRDNLDDADQASDSDGLIIIDAETLQGTTPIATVSAVMQAAQQVVFDDSYNEQYLAGATKDANDS
jgi:Tfp pilus assembly protein PilX